MTVTRSTRKPIHTLAALVLCYRVDGNTYQSPDYDHAADKIENTVKSGAGMAICLVALSA